MSSKVSIIIPAGDQTTGLINTIESCRFQSHKNVEILITATCTEVEDLVYNLDDPRIRLLATTLKSKSQRITMSLEFVKGNFVTFLMPGDSQEYDRIESQLKYSISLCNIHYADQPAKRINGQYLLPESLGKKPKDYLITLMLDIETLLDIGLFDHKEKYPIQEWLMRYFFEYGGKIPILQSRLYRKESHDRKESTSNSV